MRWRSGRLSTLVDRDSTLDDEDGPEAVKEEVEWVEITQENGPAKSETDGDQNRTSDDIPHLELS
jgi:hypothetical protein